MGYADTISAIDSATRMLVMDTPTLYRDSDALDPRVIYKEVSEKLQAKQVSDQWAT